MARETRSPQAVDDLLGRFLNAFALIASMPRLGRPRRELGRGLRSHVAAPYVILYRPHLHSIEIVRIIHQRRDLRLALARRKRREIRLTPEFEDAVWNRVDSGAYANTDEVLTACVFALERVEAEAG